MSYTRLRRLLRLLDVPTADAAARCGCSRALFSAITNGHRPPSAVLAERLAALERSLSVQAAPIVAELTEVRHA